MAPVRQTKQQLLEQIAELQRSEELWRSLVSHAPSYIAMVDRDGVMQFLNHTQPGHQWDAQAQHRIQDYIDSAFLGHVMACLESVFRTGQPTSYETVATGPHGTQAWYETHLGPVLRHGEIVATALFSTDITARKEAETAARTARDTLEQQVQARTAELLAANERLARDITYRKDMEASLQQSHQELQAIYDGMVDGLLIADLESMQFLRANQAICRMLGYSEQELVSMSVRDIHPREEHPQVLDRFAALAAGQLVRTDNIPMLRKDGSLFYADIQRNLLRYHGRDCIIGFFRDNTERKQAAEALNHEHQVLRQLLKSQDRDRQIVAYEIHDGVAQLLAAAIMQFETYQDMRRDAPRVAEQSGTVVADLLRQCHAEVRRLISGLRPPVLDAFGVVAALQHLVYESMARCDVDIEFQPDVQFERLDPTLENAIYRIAQESLANACQHSRSAKIRLELTQHGERVRIGVQDWGIGFDPQHTDEKCFGLAGIRQRARLLGGQVSITSRPGEGSHIVVELPRLHPHVDDQTLGQPRRT